MSSLIVRPIGPLQGAIPIGGAKNSVLKLMAATVLAEGDYVLRNVPDIADVGWMGGLLEHMGLTVERGDHEMTIHSPADATPEAPYELVEKMRASIVVLGPLLARFGEARVALPGGDDFGSRPIDMHLKALATRVLAAQLDALFDQWSESLCPADWLRTGRTGTTALPLQPGTVADLLVFTQADHWGFPSRAQSRVVLRQGRVASGHAPAA